MAKKARSKKSAVTVSLSDRDLRTLEKYALNEGQNKAAVLREALDALREKKRYAAKRAIESPNPNKQFRNIGEVSRLRDVERLTDVHPAPESAPINDVRNEYLRAVDERPRVTTNIDSATLGAFEKLARQSGQTKADFMRDLILDVVDPDGPLPDPKRHDPVARRANIIFYSDLFIAALEEALDYDPARHHNQPPPALRIEDSNYLNEIRALTLELKRLNQNLEAAAKADSKSTTRQKRTPRKEVEKSTIEVKKHLNTFFSKYASTLGTGAAALTIGTAGALLYQLGVPLDFIVKHVRR